MIPPSSVSASFLLSFYAVIPQIERSRFFAIFSRATLSERQDRIDGRSVYQCKSPAGIAGHLPSSGRHRVRRGRGAHREAVRGGVGGQRRQAGRVDRRSEAGCNGGEFIE